MAETDPASVALTEFEQADTRYHLLEQSFLEGEFISEMLMAPAHAHEVFKGHIEELKAALEDRNAKLKNVQDALRQKVALAPNKWRGPDGLPSLLSAGAFKVSSVTFRGFDPKSLFDLCQKRGVYERLMELKGVDKDGKEKKLVEQTWEIDYTGIMQWLKANQMQDVIDGAYDEKEGTPQVKGPKRLTFLGETKEK